MRRSPFSAMVFSFYYGQVLDNGFFSFFSVVVQFIFDVHFVSNRQWFRIHFIIAVYTEQTSKNIASQTSMFRSQYNILVHCTCVLGAYMYIYQYRSKIEREMNREREREKEMWSRLHRWDDIASASHRQKSHEHKRKKMR